MYRVSNRPSGTAGSKDFSRIPRADIPRSSFSAPFEHTTTIDAGYIYPLYWDEAYPGDTFKCRPNAFARMMTMLYPIFSNVHVDCFFFAVPMRLLWTNFVKMHGEQDDPGDSISYTTPVITSPAVTGHAEESIYDYFGLPVGAPDLEHSALPLRAYNLVYKEWFRDQDITDSPAINKGDGPDAPGDYTLLRRCKRPDYFTTCRPWTQKGDAITLPLGDTAPVVPVTDYKPRLKTVGGGGALSGIKMQQPGGGSNFMWDTPFEAGAGPFDLLWDDPKLEVDLSGATAATINTIRQAFQLQRLLERDARGGTRFPEMILSHFGVTSPDFRVQRPEFLGGLTFQIQQQAVPKMATGGVGNMGDLAAFGVGGKSSRGWIKSFDEHTIILGLMSIRADLHYQQGLHRMWSRETRYDYYYPALQHLGEQAVLTKELYAVGSGGITDDDVFGYQERFSELKYGQKLITGELRSTHTLPLDAWHLAQEFSSAPLLNDTFIQENPPMERVLAVGAGATQFLISLYLEMQKTRPMATYAVPGMVDHF